MTVPVAHDVICPWCWIGVSQARRLREDFGVGIEWLSYELMPESLPWDPPAPREPENPDRPKTPSRLQLAYAAEGLERPTSTGPARMRSHNVLEALEHAKDAGVADAAVEAVYRAYWAEGLEVDAPEVLARVLEGVVPDLDAMLEAVAERRYAARIVPFDDAAYASGVYNVPTFFIGGERYAEQPYAVLRQAMERSLVEK
jgi:predicted DsbA family dithiol-disulfide isomerase